MSAFQRLHPNLKHAIVHDLGWRSLRPVQEQAIEAIFDGDNAVVLAPTAGGKTEAAMFPILSRVLTEDSRPVTALYVCPIRALLNNIEPRAQRYARMVGLDAFKWHGDVAATKKARFRAAPTHLLMITPESLEVMLISQKTDAAVLFEGLEAVVIDEVHAFAGDDRGAHLISILERLTRFCDRDLQRIGLSATVGNPDEIGRWLQGSSRRRFRRIDPGGPPAGRDLRVELFDDENAIAQAAARLGQGRKSLVFVESRSQAERVAAAMKGRQVEVFIHHSAVSRAERQLAEEQFAQGENAAIVCTSTMELGLDVGDLDRVIQIDAPATVASLLQRMGRTGRRSERRSNCSFLCRSPEAMLQATALLRLLERGFVEEVRPNREAAHVLAHQVIALTLQEGGLSRHRLLPWLSGATPFSDLDPEDVTELIDTMVEREILHEGDGLLSLGAEGERLYGHRNFFELYAVFTAPRMLTVLHGRDDVGTLQEPFLRDVMSRDEGPAAFRLAGRAWKVTRVDWRRGICRVQPAEQGRVPSWLGQPSFLGGQLCAEMKHALADGELHPWLAPAAAAELDLLREDYEGLVAPASAALEHSDEGATWHTFAGGAINRLLAEGLEEASGRRWIAGNLSLRCPEAKSAAEAADAIDGLRNTDWDAVAVRAATRVSRSVLSKFEPCLPQHLEERLLVSRTVDIDGARRFLASHRVRRVA